MTTTQCTCTGCAVQQGTHQPAEAVHQIDEPQAEALLELAAYRFTVENREARIAELEAQLEAIGAGGVEPLRKQAAATQAVEAAVPVDMRLVPAEFVRGFSDLARNYSLQANAPDYYIGVERDAFRDAYERCGRDLAKLRAMLVAAPAHPAEGVPAQADPFMWAIQEPGGSAYMDENCVSTSRGIVEAEVDGLNLGLGADDEPYKVVPVYLAATQPAAQGMDGQALADFEAMRHSANEWADMATSGLQWLRNIVDGISDPKQALANLESNLAHCRAVNDAPGSQRAIRAIAAALAAQAKQGGA